MGGHQSVNNKSKMKKKENPQVVVEVPRKVIIAEEQAIPYKYGLAPRDCVHHYLPHNFPMKPKLTRLYAEECNRTWKMIVTANTDRMKQYSKSGIVLFYDEFFYRLFQRDNTFRYVFPDVNKRSEVLIKAITFILKNDHSNEVQVINRCNYLGHRHKIGFVGVRCHHFALFSSTAVEVLMYWLGNSATYEAGEAWSNIMCFFLFHILSAFLSDKVDPFESYQNITISHVKILKESRVSGISSRSSESESEEINQVVDNDDF